MEVRRPAQRATLTDAERDAFNKDIHLLEAALQADGIVVSCDRRLVVIVEAVQKFARKLKSIRFVDPAHESVQDLEDSTGPGRGRTLRTSPPAGSTPA